MRLRRLDLDRFGLFTDRSIDLPPAAVDFHLVVGPNEAGKSTLRAAVSELLFGIDVRSSYNFLHDYRELRLGALLEQGSERLPIVRLKRNKQALVTPEGAPLAEGTLAPFLGGVDKEFFRRMFGLDHAGLAQGGDAILNAKEDVSRMLFEASSGLSGLGELRGRLEEEAGSLWGRRRSRDRVYYQALERYEQALDELKAATVRPAQWKRAVEQVDATQAALGDGDEALHALALEAARLERIRRVAPHLQKRAELLAHGEDVAGAVELPTSAGAELAAARDGIAKAEAAIDRRTALAAQARARAEGVEVAEALLDARSAIEELEERRAQTKDFPAQIQKREAEAAVLRNTAQGIAASLGWEPGPVEGLEGRIPSVVLRAELEQLSQSHGGLVEAVRSRTAAVADLEAQLESRRQQLEALPVAEPPAALAARLERAQRLGDVEQALRQARAKARRTRDGLDQALAQLKPWTGDADALCALELPTPEDVQARLARTNELETKLSTLKERSDELRAEMDRNRLQIDQRGRGHATVTWAELSAARRERDALWSRIRGGAETPAAAGDTYEERVASADGLADRRYLAAETVQAIEQLQKGLERQGVDLGELERRAGAIEGELAVVRSDWAVLAGGLGLGALPMTQFVAWAARREQALLAYGAHADAASVLQELEATVAAEEDALRDALAELGAARDELTSVGLAELVRRAERAVASAKDARATRERLEREQQQGRDELQRRVRERDEERARLEAWKTRWDELVGEAHLPPGVGVEGVRAAMQSLRELESTLRKLDDLHRTRIATMARDLDAFERACRELVARLAPELAGEPPERAARELMGRLAGAAAARDTREEALKEQQDQERRRTDAEGELAQARRQIQPLLELAGVTKVDELAAAIQASDRRRRHETDLAEATGHAREGSDGLDLEALEQEVAAADLVALPVRLGELARQRRDAEASREKLLIDYNEAKAALGRIAGQDDAVSAAARSEEALADMAAAVERYLKVQVAARLLRWAIDRHRDEREAPLLRRASELFSPLTRGSFQRLSVDHDHEPPQLLGLRADGKHTPVDGMSDATRDQLYLALRIAAVELHLERGHALPFIADDLFINYDDGRAAAGLELLAGLAQRTQVLFLTHHDHLLPIAREVFGDSLNVVSL